MELQYFVAAGRASNIRLRSFFIRMMMPIYKHLGLDTLKRFIRVYMLILIVIMINLECKVLFAKEWAEKIKIQKAVIRLPAAGIMNTGLFMEIINSDKKEHFVLKIRSDIAEMIEIHDHVEENGIMKMKAIDKLHLIANSTTVLQPGGKHVMLIGLKRDLKEGDSVFFQLEMEDRSKMKATAKVKKNITH